jgi:CRISPR-associated protein Csm1
MNEFESYSSRLFEILSGKAPESSFLDEVIKAVPSPRYLVKGDVSGIQSFIFTIPSKYASKELKARSEYIKKYTSGWLEKIRRNCAKSILLSGGGGNFYLFANFPDKKVLEEIERQISLESPEGIYLALSWINADDPADFEKIRTGLEKEGALKKLRKYSSLPEFFEPVPVLEPQYFHLAGSFTKEGLPLWSDRLIKAFSATSAGRESVTESDEEPVEGNIISFRHLACIADIRTGTPKIAVLKMDLDNLGIFFSGLDGFGQVKQASECLDFFFSKHIFDLLDKSMEQKLSPAHLPGELLLLKNNIYVVFSGGDDCFIIGAWDGVLEFAVLLRQELRKFIREEMLDSKQRITISASVQLYSPGYPVYKFAAEAEENLHMAKYAEADKKDKIYIFGEIFSWEEFEQVLEVKEALYELIARRGESRAILERIRLSGKAYERDRESCLAGNELPRTWMMNYTLGRNIRNPENRIFAEKNILPRYESNLLRAYYEKKSLSAMIFPVAARYTELLTRNTKS